jgi:hypothetical protein
LALAEYFGEDPKQVSTKQIIGVLLQFNSLFQKSWKQHADRLRRQAKAEAAAKAPKRVKKPPRSKRESSKGDSKGLRTQSREAEDGRRGSRSSCSTGSGKPRRARDERPKTAPWSNPLLRNPMLMASSVADGDFSDDEDNTFKD